MKIENHEESETLGAQYDGFSKQVKKESKRKELQFNILLMAVTCLLSVCITSLVFVSRNDKHRAIIEAEQFIARHSFFYEKDRESELVTGALRGMAYSLEDEYADYYTSEEYAEMTQAHSGNYVGMGITIMEDGPERFFVDEVFPDSPADEAGLLAGDQIIAINGVSCEGYELLAFLELIDNTEDSTNTISVLRGAETLNFTMVMREVYKPYVHYQMLDEETGYLHIALFQGKCVEETQNALDALREQGMKKLVLDVRDNLGGALYLVNDIAELFLPADSVITTVRSKAGDEVVYKTKHQDGLDIPVVMLINEYSASGSELLAGALKDHNIARLFGVTTYGKGIVQSFFSLSNGGIIKFTTDAYYTPNDVCIQGTGIAPDVEVKLSDEWTETAVGAIPHDEDSQLQAALSYLKAL